MKEWWNRRHPTTRRLAQVYAALLYNAHARGLIEGRLYTGGAKALCVPGLNCYSCPGAVAACPLGSLQNALASAGHGAGWYVIGILLLFGITLGRTVCGWLCPMGLIQELLHKIPTPKLRKSRVTRALSYLKYAALTVFVIALPLIYGQAYGLPLPAFCKYLCPAGTLEGAIGLLAHPDNGGMFAQLGVLFTRKFVILLAVGAACVFCYRAFCRFLCPLGAIYGLFNRFALTGVKLDAGRCTHCGACVKHCPMDIRHVGDHECISCGQCVSRCAQGALAFKCGSVTLQEAGKTPDRRRRRAAWSVLLAVLVCAVLYFNVIDKPESVPAAGVEAEDTADSIPAGHEVGQRLPDFSCTLTDGSVFRLSDARGKVVIINQWATYCTPCVGELPWFERLQEEHPDISVLAVHHWLETKPGAAAFIGEKGWDGWSIRFAVDTKEQNLVGLIGGDNTMPRTLVLNRQGVVVYNEQRSVTYEMLEQLLELASR